jgi:hypothetical protein
MFPGAALKQKSDGFVSLIKLRTSVIITKINIMISEKIEKAINEQIKLEEHSSRVYMSMASWCESKGLSWGGCFSLQAQR